VWWKADRDPRGHAVTLAYQWTYVDGDILAADDAKAIIKVRPSDLDSIHFAFPDHKEMIIQALNL
jgi:ADP-ribose pyrophosphatase YjhB (NUDIX family)